MNISAQYKYVIFDLDGTLVTTKSGATYRKGAKDWQWLPNRVEKCKRLLSEGVVLGIATNQAGVAFEWSRFTEYEIQREIDLVAREIGVYPIHVRVCYTTPNTQASRHYWNTKDNRRKPAPGMLLEIIKDTDLTIDKFLMVGVREEDILAAKTAGIDFMQAEEFFR